MKLGKTENSGPDYGVVGQGIEITGDITFADQLQVYGKISGKIHSKSGTLVIGESGQLDAEVDVGTCVIYGAVRGNVAGRAKVEIRRTGRITGDVQTPVLLVEEGAVFNGVIRMGQESVGRRLEEVPSADSGEAPRQVRRA
ncbi:MAG TPA: polymer-forming cytoskeletal protein [Blastocatellia bacterium]|nr:polymer-forming cytoskeletal protein [Blastocatellia bacterium]